MIPLPAAGTSPIPWIDALEANTLAPVEKLTYATITPSGISLMEWPCVNSPICLAKAKPPR